MAKKKIPGYMPGGRPKKAGKNDMMKQIQKMQSEMMQRQEDLEDEEITATAGGGAVAVTVNGKMAISGVKIDPDVIDEDDVEMLEDLVMAAANEALSKMQEKTNSQLGDFTGGMNIPGLF